MTDIFGTGSFIRETSLEIYPTTKDKLFWAIEKGFINVFLTNQGDIFFGFDSEDGPHAFGKLSASEFLIKLFGFSGGIPINAEEMTFLLKDIINGYDSDNFYEYSLFSEGK